MQTLLNPQIAANRKENAPQLAAMADTVQSWVENLERVETSTLSFPKPANLASLLQECRSLQSRMRNKQRLFESGQITVSVAGVEKSGKTTMLQTLTGITALPTADERCTSVPCDIVYTEGEEDFLLEYHTEQSLMESVVLPLWKSLEAPAIWQSGCPGMPPAPSSLGGFTSTSLPASESMRPEDTPKYGSTLETLRETQKCLEKHSNLLGTQEKVKDLGELARFAGHATKDNEDVSILQNIIHKIVVSKKFEGGSASLRLCDTPGFDDPNPIARRRTYKTIAEESDMLVVVNRPGVTPSITEPLAQFISDMKGLDVDMPLRERSVFFVNWHKQLDPDKKNADIRRDKVEKEGVFGGNSLYGPTDVTDEGEMRKFMDYLNARMANELPTQDRALLEKFKNAMEDMRAKLRLDVLKKLEASCPPMGAELADNLQNRFLEWFDSDEGGDTQSYFYGRLKTGMNRMSKGGGMQELIAELHHSIQDVFNQRAKEIAQWVADTITVEKCQEAIDAHEEPEDLFLPDLATQMNNIVNELTAAVEDLGPSIQKVVMGVIRNALGDSVARKLCPGKDAAAQLTSLRVVVLEAARSDSDAGKQVAFLAENMREFAELSAQMRYIMRYQLRPCLNLLDPFRWHHERRIALVNQVLSIMKESTGERDKKFVEVLETYAQPDCHIPNKNDSPEDCEKFLKRMASFSIATLRSILFSNSGKLQDLMDDFLAQASQSLATQKGCKVGWRLALMRQKHIILEAESRELMRRSQESRNFADMLDQLRDAISANSRASSPHP